MDWGSFANIVKDGGGYGLALVAVYALVRGWVVPASVLMNERREKERERGRADRLEAILYKGTWVAEMATQVAEEERHDKEALQKKVQDVTAARDRGEL